MSHIEQGAAPPLIMCVGWNYVALRLAAGGGAAAGPDPLNLILAGGGSVGGWVLALALTAILTTLIGYKRMRHSPLRRSRRHSLGARCAPLMLAPLIGHSPPWSGPTLTCARARAHSYSATTRAVNGSKWEHPSKVCSPRRRI